MYQLTPPSHALKDSAGISKVNQKTLPSLLIFLRLSDNFSLSETWSHFELLSIVFNWITCCCPIVAFVVVVASRPPPSRLTKQFSRHKSTHLAADVKQSHDEGPRGAVRPDQATFVTILLSCVAQILVNFSGYFAKLHISTRICCGYFWGKFLD